VSVELTIANDLQPMKAIPGPKGSLITGNLSEIQFKHFHQYVKKHAKEYGSIFRLSFAHKPVIVLSDPEIIRSILKNRPDKFRRISSMQAVFSELGINGVFSSEGEQWKIQRQMMNQAFKSSQIKQYYPIVTETTERLCAVMSKLAIDQEGVDLQALLQRYTVDITSSLAFGYEVNSLNNDDSELQKMINIVFPMLSERIKAPFPYWRYFKLAKDKQLDQSIAFIKQQSEEFIQAAEKKISHGQAPANILEAMILARDEEGNSFTQEQLISNILTLLLAGEDTTANTLSWIIHYLTEYPKYQEKIHSEISENLSKTDLTDPNSLDDFPFLTAVIQEAMRLMPVAPFLYLENISAENIAGYQIPAGTMLIMLLSQTGHDETKFVEPENFKPERWINMSDESKKKHAKELMHFGGGARLCPGMQLSFVEMKYALISLFKQFVFSKSNTNKKVKDYFAFTVTPKNLMVNVHLREESI